LVDILNTDDPDMRCDAAEALLRIDPSQAVDMVLPLLGDSDMTVRWYTCGLLHDFGDSRAIPSVVKLLRTDPEGRVRHVAAFALGAIGNSTALPALKEAVDSDDGADHEGRPVREMAEEAMEEIMKRA
jgi:HEAT repeat protein